MSIQEIGENAGVVWRTLYKNDEEMDLNQLVNATHLGQIEMMAAIGWLSREGKIHIHETADGTFYSVYKECYY